MGMRAAVVAGLAGVGVLAASGRADDLRVPVLREVDVVVAGGGCGAVAAAEAAAQAGASVFLFAPRTYLGDDIAGGLQLWLEPGETPAPGLAADVFADPSAARRPTVAYSYKADQKTNEKHKDTWPPSMLSRQRPAEDPQHDSVQYDADVVLTLTLGEEKAVRAVELVAFRRAGDFEVGGASLRVSSDAKTWRDAKDAEPVHKQGITRVTFPVDGSLRFAKLTVRRADGAKRLLLGSVAVLPEGEAAAVPAVPRPLHVKSTLDKALLAAKVPFLFGCYPSDLLVDASGRPAGVVLANRMGRQAVRAKVVIDATEDATFARLAGVEFRPPGAAPRTARWVAVSAEPRESADFDVRRLPGTLPVYDMKGQSLRTDPASWFEYTLPVPPDDGSWAARARFEQALRDATVQTSQLYTADAPAIPPAQGIRGAAATVPGCFRPAGVDRLWVVGGCADIPRDQVARFLRPVAMMAAGAEAGRAAAKEAAALSAPAEVRVAPRRDGDAVPAASVMEERMGLRPIPAPATVADAPPRLPLLGRYDVVVVGGGTAGAAAGIGAARRGARTLVVEYLHGLGGVGTLGMIGKYWYGNRVGFAAAVPQNPVEARMEFYRSELRKAGADIWFGAIGCGALVETGRVAGVLVATPFGRGLVRARVVIDGTGNADLAAAAGAETRFVEDFFALQASHIPPREVGASYINGNRTPIDAADPIDVTESMLSIAGHGFDRGQCVASRERRRIVGDVTLDWIDQITLRAFPDSIARAVSDYDSHGYQTHPFFMLRPARPPGDHKRQFWSEVPYRCLLPRGLDGLLVVGLGLSAHRDAMPIVRMQPDLQNIGYAAGMAAATCAKTGRPTRAVDVTALQKDLVKEGILAAGAVGARDSFPLPDTAIDKAVAAIPNAYEGLEVLMTAPERAVPRLRAAHDAAPADRRLPFAQVLGVMGDAHGAATLAAEARRRLETNDLPTQRGEDNMNPVEQLVWALGRCGDAGAVEWLGQIAERTPPGSAPRLRALAVSLGASGSPAAVPALKSMLTSLAGTGDVPELMAACALHRCGDPDGLARKTLERFAAGPNGPFSRLAWQVLSSPPRGRRE